MNRLATIGSALSLLLLAPALLACEYPSRVDIPNGNSASKEEMVDGQRSVKEYVALMEAYLECIVAEEKAFRSQTDNLSAEDEQAREEMLNKKYNAAVDEMETTAARFNAEVRVFKERSD